MTHYFQRNQTSAYEQAVGPSIFERQAIMAQILRGQWSGEDHVTREQACANQ